MTEFLLLGPFEAPLPVPGGKPKALLARLLLDQGRVVPSEALVDALWADPPPSAAKVLQGHVSAVRKAIGADAIETRGGGYVLRSATSDVGRFEALTEEAAAETNVERRAALLREALALWRGEPLSEFRREPFAQPAAARLHELRLRALLQRIDAELELGSHEDVVAELRTLVDEEPLREQVRARLMQALYRSGRQAEALAVYRDGRRMMVEELGIEPGRELQELERAILRQDARLDEAHRKERRGSVVCLDSAPIDLVGPLGRELLLVELPREAGALTEATTRLDRLRSPRIRTACFTSSDPTADVIRLVTEQEAELLVVTDAPPGLLADAPCDVALLKEAPFEAAGPIVAPFGGDREEWPALELAAWLARAHGVGLRILGVEATSQRRDASRTLAAASLALQRFAGVAAEPAIVPPGSEAVLAQGGSAIVASLPRALDEVRRELLDRSRVPVLLVHGGLRPSGLAPEQTLTRFSWSAAPAQNRP